MSIDKCNFLYAKNQVPGIIEEEVTRFDLWENGVEELELLKETLMECTFFELLINLIDIFRYGTPNSSRLASLFGKDYDYSCGEANCYAGLIRAYRTKGKFKKQHGNGSAGMDDSNKVVILIKNVERKLHDIAKVELNIEVESFNINTIYLYVFKMPDVYYIENKLKDIYEEISIDVSKSVVISDYSYKIMVIEYEKGSK